MDVKEASNQNKALTDCQAASLVSPCRLRNDTAPASAVGLLRTNSSWFAVGISPASTRSRRLSSSRAKCPSGRFFDLVVKECDQRLIANILAGHLARGAI